MNLQILLYAKDYDEFVNHVIDYLDNGSYLRIGIDNLVQLTSVNLNMHNTTAIIATDYSNQACLSTIKSVWFNGGGLAFQPRNVSPELNQLNSDNFNLILKGIIGGRNLKRIGTFDNSTDSNKVKNLIVAANCGLITPSTLITTSKPELIRFKEACEQEVICKRINDADKFFEKGYLYDNSKTFILTNEILEDLPDQFQFSLFQERIYKEYEVRVILFDSQLYACAIIDTTDALDYRTNLSSSKSRPRIVPYQLPIDVEGKLKSLTEKLGYTFCSIDLLYSKSGDFVFLEVNPCGQISFINNACNYYLEKEFADLLKRT